MFFRKEVMFLKIEFDSDKHLITLDGSINSNNANEVEKEIFDKVEGCLDSELTIDATKLSYISSAGLRVLLKLQKKCKKTITIENVSRDVYDIFDVTGFTEILTVKKAYREVSVDGCKVIGKGFFGTVYRIDEDTIIKVYHGQDSIPMILNEQKMAKKAFIKGIPTAISYDIVKVGEDYGSVFELLNAKSFNDLVIEGEIPLEELVKKYVELLKIVHSTEVEEDELPSARIVFIDYLKTIKDYLSDDEYTGLMSIISKAEDDYHMIHGDVQMKNVMMVDNEPMLIDMDTICAGNPLFELQGLYVTYIVFGEDEKDNTMNFLGISQETADKIWELVLEYYFGISKKSEEEKESILNKIKLLAYVRFLFIVISSDLKNSELGELRIKHSKEHIDELLKLVDNISI